MVRVGSPTWGSIRPLDLDRAMVHPLPYHPIGWLAESLFLALHMSCGHGLDLHAVPRLTRALSQCILWTRSTNPISPLTGMRSTFS